MLLERYDEARLLADAKGWTLDGVAAEIVEQIEQKKRPELSELSLSAATLQRRSVTPRHVPRPLAELVEELKTHQGREHLTEIVETGLRVMRGQPAPTRGEPRELALALLASFPTEEFALKLAGALASRAGGKGSLLGKLARRMARLVAKRLALGGPAPSAAPDVLQSTVNHTDAKVDVLIAKLDISEGQRRKDKRELIRAQWLSSGLALLGFVAAAHCQHTQGAIQPAAVVVAPAPVIVTLGAGAAQEAARAWEGLPHALLGPFAEGADQMGGKKLEEDEGVPKEAFPEQKVAPCNPDAGESTINGSCWVLVGKMAPPCRLLYRYENSCYRPVAASPKQKRPVGEFQALPNPEHR